MSFLGCFHNEPGADDVNIWYSSNFLIAQRISFRFSSHATEKAKDKCFCRLQLRSFQSQDIHPTAKYLSIDGLDATYSVWEKFVDCLRDIKDRVVEISVEDCNRLPSRAFSSLWPRLLNLQAVYVTRCPTFNAYSLQGLDQLTLLFHLSFHSCPYVRWMSSIAYLDPGVVYTTVVSHELGWRWCIAPCC